MGKAEKTGIGRALVKHHNHTIQESKEKGRFYRNQHKNVLESVTDVTDIEAVIEQADESFRLFSVNHPPANVLINLDSSSSTSKMAPKELREQQLKEETLHASSLRIPRRPPWNAKMSVEELDANERRAFLTWRRRLASIEENEKLVLTPFEKNLDIWRQLWRVVERSDLVVMVVDARDPLFYHFPDLEAYAKEVDEHKRTLLLINKADLLPFSVREKWARYFHLHGILYIFWSAKAATETLGGKSAAYNTQDGQESADDTDTKIHGREELLARLQYEAETVVSVRNMSGLNSSSPSVEETSHGNSKFKGVIVGFVGYPNVGKSSTINALVGEKRAGVTSTPGKTKHFQTLIISDQLMLCDCPGLVFPSFTSSRYEMIASGVLPIDKMTEHREAVQVVANRVPRHVIENVYNISLPKPKPYEPQSRLPLASEVLRAFCVSRGYVASSGLPDETRAARLILKDYINGKLPHFELPPGEVVSSNDKEDSEGAPNPPLSSEEEEEEEEEEEDSSSETTEANEIAPSLHHVLLDDLSSFDMVNGLASVEEKGRRKKPSGAAPHKLHKKPQRKKDRSWRVKADGSDGMPMVRVFQKSVSAGPLKS